MACMADSTVVCWVSASLTPPKSSKGGWTRRAQRCAKATITRNGNSCRLICVDEIAIRKTLIQESLVILRFWLKVDQHLSDVSLVRH
jgi:hypothetical protein